MTLELSTHVKLVDTEHGAVLLDEHSGRYWQLNASGLLALHSMLTGAAPDETAHRLARHYPVDRDRALADVTRLVDELRAARLVVS